MKIYIETVGCKLNQFESSALAEKFREGRASVVDRLEESDTVVVNTCTVTNAADVKSRQVMRRARKLGKRVVATGCYATTDFDGLDGSGLADLVVRNDRKFSIPDLLRDRLDLEKRLPPTPRDEEFPVVRQFDRTRAFLKVQDGCDRFCSYCKIPHARGRSRSLSPERALSFLKILLDAGYREVVLTGVNLSDYRYNNVRLSGLVEKALEIPGPDFRLRLSSLQPDEFEARLPDFLHHPRFAAHFHLSLQSGSATVLARMERNYTPEFFLDLCGRIRARRDDCGITTDIIAGFPGETEQEFEDTLETVRRARFTRVHAFPYSPRSGTKASRMKTLDGLTVKNRVRRLDQDALETALNFARERVVGREQTVLAENPENGFGTGYTSNYLKVTCPLAWTENEFVRVVPDGVKSGGPGVMELTARGK